MSHVQIARAPVPRERRDDHVAHPRAVAAIFREHGAIVADDLRDVDLVPGEQTDFLRAVAAADEESVVLARMTWPSKAHAEDAVRAMGGDPRMATIEMPFDGRRPAFGESESTAPAPCSDAGRDANIAAT